MCALLGILCYTTFELASKFTGIGERSATIKFNPNFIYRETEAERVNSILKLPVELSAEMDLEPIALLFSGFSFEQHIYSIDIQYIPGCRWHVL